MHPLRRPVKKHIFHDLFAYKKQNIRLVEQNPIAHNRATEMDKEMPKEISSTALAESSIVIKARAVE